jgi:hypothetical protein
MKEKVIYCCLTSTEPFLYLSVIFSNKLNGERIESKDKIKSCSNDLSLPFSCVNISIRISIVPAYTRKTP